MCVSIFQIQWIYTNINIGIDGAVDSETVLRQKLIANMTNESTHSFSFEYLFSIMIACLIWKMLEIIQFHADIGPLVKIVEKMFGDFSNFIILYAILVIMFAIIGNANFVFDLTEYKGFFESVLTVLDASIGNYDFGLFEQIDKDFLARFGDIYVMAIVVVFNILILNLIIAILSNTYQQFDQKATGLYLSKILNARDYMAFNENYGAFLLIMAPMNIVILPFVPFAMFMKPNVSTNTMLTILQYSVFIIIIYSIFMIISCLLIPFAYMKSLGIKIQYFLRASSIKDKIITLFQLVIYLAAGIPMLVMCMFSDFYYFCANNFRSNLKKIIIEKQKSTLNDESIRQMKDYCSRYIYLKIKSMYTTETVQTFRQKFVVIENIQYMMFGQFLAQGERALGTVLGFPR